MVNALVGVLVLLLAVGFIAGLWWLLNRALNGDHPPETGGSYGDQLLGEWNTRKKRARRRGSRTR